MDGQPGAIFKQGIASVTNAASDATVIAAQGAAKKIFLLRGLLSVTVAAVGGGGRVALEDGVGGTRLLQVNADAVGAYFFDLGPRGYQLTADTPLNLTTDSALTTQASASVILVAYVNP